MKLIALFMSSITGIAVSSAHAADNNYPTKPIIVPYGNAQLYQKTGALTILGSFEDERMAAASDVIPLRELGYPGVVVPVWTGFFAPHGTPAPIIEKLNYEINAILKLPDVREKLANNGQTIVSGDPDVLAKVVKQDLDRYAPIVRAANITAE